MHFFFSHCPQITFRVARLSAWVLVVDGQVGQGWASRASQAGQCGLGVTDMGSGMRLPL